MCYMGVVRGDSGGEKTKKKTHSHSIVVQTYGLG